jgi:glutaryl-CoA dehydrogenase
MSHRHFDTSDFYSYEHLLTDEERNHLISVRKFMTTDVAPLLLEHWSRATFPFEISPGMRELGLAGLPYHGFGCGGRRYLLDGMIAMELARIDCSIATFNGVHGGLAMGSTICAAPTSNGNDFCRPWRATTRSARSG